MLEELLVGHASRRVLLQQPAHQVHALVRQLAGDTTRDARVPARDVAQERHRVGARERRRAAHELEQDTPDAPEVRLGVVLLVAQDLRRHVQGRAAQRLGQTARVHVPREAKVGDLERRGGIRRVLLGAERRLLGSRSAFDLRADVRRGRAAQQQVLRLQVTVYEVPRAHLPQTARDLRGERSRDGLGDAADAPQVLRQVAERAVLEHQEHRLVGLVLHDVQQRDDVLVFARAQHVDLGLQRAQELAVQTTRADLLDGDPLRRAGFGFGFARHAFFIPEARRGFIREPRRRRRRRWWRGGHLA